jgi:hypothetical protein
MSPVWLAMVTFAAVNHYQMKDEVWLTYWTTETEYRYKSFLI